MDFKPELEIKESIKKRIFDHAYIPDTPLYRALLVSKDTAIENFLPTFITNFMNDGNLNKVTEPKFVPPFVSSHSLSYSSYSVSVFDTLQRCVDNANSFIAFKDVKGYAVGHYDEKKGVCNLDDNASKEGHIHYFLFDPIGNNINVDFEVVKDDEQ